MKRNQRKPKATHFWKKFHFGEILADEDIRLLSSSAYGILVRIWNLTCNDRFNTVKVLTTNDRDNNEIITLYHKYKDFKKDNNKKVLDAYFLSFDVDQIITNDANFRKQILSDNLLNNLSYHEQDAQQTIKQIADKIDKQNFCLCLLTVWLTKATGWSTKEVLKGVVELIKRRVIILGENFIFPKPNLKTFADEKLNLTNKELPFQQTETDKESGFVYFISNKTSCYKVGVSTNVKEKLYQLRSKNQEHALEIVHEVFVDDIHQYRNFVQSKFVNTTGFGLNYELPTNKEQIFVDLFVNAQTNEQTNNLSTNQTNDITNDLLPDKTNDLFSSVANSNFIFNSLVNKEDNLDSSSSNLKEEIIDLKKEKIEKEEKFDKTDKQKTNRKQTESKQKLELGLTETQPNPTPFQKNPNNFPTSDNNDFKQITPHFLELAKQKYKLTHGVDLQQNELMEWFNFFCSITLNGESFYKNPNAFYKHFVNWIGFQKLERKSNPTPQQSTPNPIKHQVKDLTIYENKPLRTRKT